MELIGGKIGQNNECAKFSTQFEFLYKSWGAHKINLLSKGKQLKFLEYCPESKFLITRK